MQTTPVTPADLRASVLAVPPLARHADLTLNRDANAKLVRHVERGGVTTLLYGGNANLYNAPLSEFPALLDMLAGIAGERTLVIPSVGPDYGRLIDQARVLRELPFPTAMVLPLQFPATPAGTEAGVRRFVERCGKPVVLYIKSESWLSAERAAALIEDGTAWAIKYAVPRNDPADDPYLAELVARVGPERIVSGMGERPAAAHLQRFGLAGFTSGSVCLAPRAATALLQALHGGDAAAAERLWQAFKPLEDLRDRISPFAVLHDAVTLAGVAEMGPLLPLLANLEPEHQGAVAVAARELLAFDGSVA